ncbi:amidohydrolase [Sphingomonas sp.]|uniref:amidohydrolase family protein n=1 Tax=Sphingomonas sp. TaxID=28214 RepID=UPI0025D65067|nr:amidohydrolase family protein [Sphingomonas sp.]
MKDRSIGPGRREVVAAGLAWAGAAMADARIAASREPLFDSHAHLVSPDTIRYPQVPADAPGATANLPGMGFRQFGTARPVPGAEAMAGWMKQKGVDGLAAIQKRGAYGLDNRYILDSAAHYPHLFFPVVILDAQDDATPGTVRDLAARGLAGVRLTGVMASDGGFPWLASDRALRLWDTAAKTGLVMEIMTNPFGHPVEALPVYVDLALRFPGVPIVIDHLNWPDAHGAPDFGLDAPLRALAARPNIFFKFTTINMDKLQDAGISSAAFLAHAVGLFGAGRILWGSDMGNTPGSYAELIGRARASAGHLPMAARRAVFHDNGRRLFTRRAGV